MNVKVYETRNDGEATPDEAACGRGNGNLSAPPNRRDLRAVHQDYGVGNLFVWGECAVSENGLHGHRKARPYSRLILLEAPANAPDETNPAKSIAKTVLTKQKRAGLMQPSPPISCLRFLIIRGLIQFLFCRRHRDRLRGNRVTFHRALDGDGMAGVLGGLIFRL